MSKVRVDLSDAVNQLNQFSNAGIKLAANEIEKKIISEIEAGRSPVKNVKRRFPRYSDSYRKTIKKSRGIFASKRVSPVNLKLTGKLLQSIFSRSVGSSKVQIGFDNFLADIHNREGAGKSRIVRRMLPTNPGETFTDNIFKAVLARLDRFGRRIFR